MRFRLNNIITNLNLMDQMFENQATINNLQTAYDICLNARYTYEFWLTNQFRFVNKKLEPGITYLLIKTKNHLQQAFR